MKSIELVIGIVIVTLINSNDAKRKYADDKSEWLNINTDQVESSIKREISSRSDLISKVAKLIFKRNKVNNESRPDIDLCENTDTNVKRSLCAKAVRQIYHHDSGYRGIIFTKENEDIDRYKCVQRTIKEDLRKCRFMINCPKPILMMDNRKVLKNGFLMLGSVFENTVYGLFEKSEKRLTDDGIISAYPWFELHGLHLFTPLENNPEYSDGWQYLYRVTRKVHFDENKNEIYPV